ncbi:MAG TPA: hypothetical protein VFK41_03400 [Nocardioidaceae bacterium]|nr:hypothetical protein [Nocardioidaceae bacterium]
MPRHQPLFRRVSRGVALGLVGVVLTATAVGCTGGDDESTNDTTPTTTPTPPAEVPLNVTVKNVAGELSKKARQRVVAGIEDTVQRYVDGAFLGDYPHGEFALARFTAGAEKRGVRDLDLLTGRAFRDAEEVTAKQLKAQLSVLAPEGRPAGATARIRFAFDVDGTPVVVTGRLVLTPQEGTWRIFGYDVSSNASDVAAATGKVG